MEQLVFTGCPRGHGRGVLVVSWDHHHLPIRTIHKGFWARFHVSLKNFMYYKGFFREGFLRTNMTWKDAAIIPGHHPLRGDALDSRKG